VASTTNHYDLIVLGCDIAGLVAAALVARRGKRVLVIPQGPAGGTYRLGGRELRLSDAPAVAMQSPAVQRVFTELGLWQQIRRQIAVVSGLVHLVLPDQRLDVTTAEGNLAEETAREWPDDDVDAAWGLWHRWSTATDEVLDALLSSDNALVADGFWSRRSLSRIASQLPGPDLDELEPLPPDHPMRRAATAMEPWLQHLTPAQLGKAASLRLRSRWAAGPHDVPDGDAGIRRALLQRLELHSGEVKPDLRVAELTLRRGKVSGVSLLGKRDRYGCDHMIVSTDPNALLQGMLEPGQIPKPLALARQAIDAIAHRFVMHVEIDERGLSPALAGMCVCVPESTPATSEDDDATQWAAHGVGHTYVRPSAGSSDGLRHLTITRIVAAGDDLSQMRERVLADLDERGVLPFCHDYVQLMHSPHDDRDPTDGRGRVRNDLGPTSVAQPMAPLWMVQAAPSLGVGVLPHASGLRNLYLASRLTLPGLGLEGEFAAGTMAAGLVAAPAKSPFSRSPLLSRA
jgi:phytoene dehydrogenase-like protein